MKRSYFKGKRRLLLLGAFFAFGVSAVVTLSGIAGAGGTSEQAPLAAPPVLAAALPLGTTVVFGYNDLGMHCINEDFSELMVLPPYNTLHAQVIDRGSDPHIVTSGVTVTYTIPSNTHSADKTNFWTFSGPLFGAPLAPNVGLTGSKLSGTMARTTSNDYSVVGIPVTPIDDSGRENPFPLATITVKRNGVVVARTQTVVPVSWEMNCNLCHKTPGISTATDILRAHDRLHGTTLEHQKPVMCAKCHADPALGAPGATGVSNLSSAMHTAHAPRMAAAKLAVDCYACHPGLRTKCLRDVHVNRGMTCTSCHGDMAAVGQPTRRPWADEPRCGNCHTRTGYEFEQPNTLFRDSVGHQGVHCEACHGSPHAITPTTTATDNVQANSLQGYPGTISLCTVCHTQQPSEAFPHRVGD